MALLWPDQNWPVRVVPVCINTVQFPLPSAARCYKLGEAMGRAVASVGRATRRCRAGHRRPEPPARRRARRLHQQGLRPASSWTAWSATTRAGRRSSTSTELVEQTGTQGVELLMWLAARGALGPRCASCTATITSRSRTPRPNTAGPDADAAGAAAGVRKGSSGKWGPVPMPANATPSDDEIKTLVKWVLGGAK
jgi:hypothetical protein